MPYSVEEVIERGKAQVPGMCAELEGILAEARTDLEDGKDFSKLHVPVDEIAELSHGIVASIMIGEVLEEMRDTE